MAGTVLPDGDFVVGPYEPCDRPHVRRICCDVAWGGRPLEAWLDLDRELFADLFTAYYTDHDPSSVFVARGPRGVCGYVVACTDTARYRRIWPRAVLLPSLWQVAWGRRRVRPGVIPPLLALGWGYVRSRGLRVPWRLYPGHLHLNTDPCFRGCARLSRALLQRAFDHLRSHDVTRLHAVVMTSRARMEEKYERLGFRVVGRYPVPRLARRGPHACWLVLTMDLTTLPPHPLETRTLRRATGDLAREGSDR